ncbi:hypothetical protein PVAP13_2KG313404 [Panicum virgatum]|uniref:Uncharacterized protein n=1 Tax=Panicum virgatum TaxID=38727 RepID=A0A8T0W6K3_PANVG|nr:hypothetical protein PVAP13_2KG313404 [Panicum virgatum]
MERGERRTREQEYFRQGWILARAAGEPEAGAWDRRHRRQVEAAPYYDERAASHQSTSRGHRLECPRLAAPGSFFFCKLSLLQTAYRPTLYMPLLASRFIHILYMSYRHGVQKKKKQILTAHLLYSLFVYKCAGQRSMTLNYVHAYCLFFLVLKFCADRKKAKLKVGTLAIWEAFSRPM